MSGRHHNNSQITLRQWAWRSFVTTILAPLLIVEIVLLSAYGLGSQINYNASIKTLNILAQRQMTDMVSDEARVLSTHFSALESQTELLADQALVSLKSKQDISEFEKNLYQYRSDGSVVLPKTSGHRASVYYSGFVSVGELEKEKMYRTTSLDPVLYSLVKNNSLVAQAYINTHDSMCRIYPQNDFAEFHVGFNMDIPTYNFYFLADNEHNPDRKVVWTEAYIDPVTSDWIISVIAPVYEGDRLEAVVGLDVMLTQLIEDALSLELPWEGGHTMLVNQDGGLIAASTVIRDLFPYSKKKADTTGGAYSLFMNPKTKHFASDISVASSGVLRIDEKYPRLIAWKYIPNINWWLVISAAEADIYAPAERVRSQAIRNGIGLVLGVLIFYSVFLLVLYKRSRSQISTITEPLAQLKQAIQRIMAGEYQQSFIFSQVTEIEDISKDTVKMGRVLGQNLQRLQEQDQALTDAREKEMRARVMVEARTTFMANVSHEIRTPMNGIIGNLDLITLDGMNTEQVDSIETIRRSANMLLTLIDDLLDGVKTQDGSFSLENISFNLKDNLLDIVHLFRAKAVSKNIELQADLDLEEPVVLGDPTRTRQVITNLISNALKFTSDGGVYLRVWRVNTLIHFEVNDTGIGIPEDRQTAIFNAFTQADVSTTRQFGGTGLGLTISAAIVKRMGGVLSVESQLGKGSRFSFDVEMPVANSLDPTSKLPDSYVATRFVELNILVAEDNLVNQKIVQRILSRLGHQSEIVNDGQEAIDAAVVGDYDLIVLDVHMPNLDGRDAAKKFRSLPKTRDVPILGLTAGVTTDDIYMNMKAGMDLVVGKPVTSNTLQEAISIVMTAKPAMNILNIDESSKTQSGDE